MDSTAPAPQTATLKVVDFNFPGMDRFAKRFLFTEEWYEFGAPKSDDLKFLLAVGAILAIGLLPFGAFAALGQR